MRDGSTQTYFIFLGNSLVGSQVFVSENRIWRSPVSRAFGEKLSLRDSSQPLSAVVVELVETYYWDGRIKALKVRKIILAEYIYVF